MNLIEVVILAGSQCLSPLQTGPGLTEVNKVNCAVLVRQDPQTANVEILPRSAATDPEVVAMLVKPGLFDDAVAVAEPPAGRAEPDVTASISPVKPPLEIPQPKVKPAHKLETARVEPKPKPAIKREAKQTASMVVRKKKTAARRTDSCGSYRAVWYTNKEGRRKYRCVRTG